MKTELFVKAMYEKCMRIKGVRYILRHQEPALPEFGGLTADQKKLIMQNYQSDRNEFMKERDII